MLLDSGQRTSCVLPTDQLCTRERVELLIEHFGRCERTNIGSQHLQHGQQKWYEHAWLATVKVLNE